jgi:hypothetical protein
VCHSDGSRQRVARPTSFSGDVGIVILVSFATTGEGDLFLQTIAIELIIDKLRAVVGIKTQQGKGQTLTGILYRRKDVDLGLVAHGDALGPGRFYIGEAEHPGVICALYDESTAVIDQIHLTETGSILIPVRPSANRDTVFEQRAGLGEAPRLAYLRAATCQEPIYARGTDLHQLFVAFRTHLQKAIGVQSWQFDSHCCT